MMMGQEGKARVADMGYHGRRVQEWWLTPTPISSIKRFREEILIEVLK